MKALVDRIRSVFQELRQRKVVRTVLVFGGGGGATLGALDILSPLFPFIDRVFPYLVLAGILAFPVVLVLAWAYELTPEGVRLTQPLDGHTPSVATRLGAVLFVGASSLGFGAFAATVWLPGDESAPAPAAPLTSIAVQYFEDFSTDGSLGAVAESLTELLTTELSDVSGLDVKSRSQMRHMRDRGLPVDSTMAALGVGTWVEGSVAGSADALLVTVQLIEAATGNHLWSGEFRSGEGEYLPLLDTLRTAIGLRLRQELGLEVMDRADRAGATSEEALSYFILGRQAEQAAEDVGLQDQDAALAYLATADSLMGRAQALDTEWSAPIIWRGWVDIFRGFSSADRPGTVSSDFAQRAASHGDEALALSPEDPIALELKGVATYYMAEASTDPSPLYTEAERYLREAVRLDPLRARAWYSLSRIQWVRTEFSSARVSAEQALAADPFLVERPRILHHLVQTNTDLRDLPEAARWCAQGRSEHPDKVDFMICRLFELSSFDRRVDPGEAWAFVDTIRAAVGESAWPDYEPWTNMQMALILARDQDADSALFLVQRARGPDPDPYWAYDEARVMHILGDVDLTLDLLETHLEYQPSRKTYLRGDWWFETLLDNPRFRSLTGG